MPNGLDAKVNGSETPRKAGRTPVLGSSNGARPPRLDARAATATAARRARDREPPVRRGALLPVPARSGQRRSGAGAATSQALERQAAPAATAPARPRWSRRSRSSAASSRAPTARRAVARRAPSRAASRCACSPSACSAWSRPTASSGTSPPTSIRWGWSSASGPQIALEDYGLAERGPRPGVQQRERRRPRPHDAARSRRAAARDLLPHDRRRARPPPRRRAARLAAEPHGEHAQPAAADARRSHAASSSR